MTSAMRAKYDRDHGKTKKQFETIRIRVRFSDRTQIESVFPHASTILDVYDFVDSVLAEGQHGPYLLFQSPPRRDFPRAPSSKSHTLRALGFAPAAVLGIRWSDPSKNGKFAVAWDTSRDLTPSRTYTSAP